MLMCVTVRVGYAFVVAHLHGFALLTILKFSTLFHKMMWAAMTYLFNDETVKLFLNNRCFLNKPQINGLHRKECK